jgi:hypothetical protein
MRILIATIVALLLIPFSLACECKPSTPQARFEGSSIVFEGTVVSKGIFSDTTTLKVDRIYKGDDTAYITIKTLYGSSCAYVFEEGEQYLVYTSEHLNVGACSGTERSEAADRSALPEGRAPPEENFFGMMSLRQNIAWVMIFIVLVIVGTFWHLRLRKRLEAK